MPRLEKGPAYGLIDLRPSSLQLRTSSDWPTYRHDARRTGATTNSVPADAAPLWATLLKAPLTPPVVAASRVLVAAKDEHSLYALRAGDGSVAWTFTAGGRIDSPPTTHGDCTVFGCTDGHLYCLRTSDGELAWRLRVAPTERLIVSESQLESAWPVHGSVLVVDGTAYATAGRSTYLDGGIRVVAVEVATGRVKHEMTLDTWSRTRDDAVGKPFVAGYHMEGSNSDILVREGGHIFMGQYKFDKELNQLDTPYILPDQDDPKPKALDLTDQPFADKSVRGTEGLEVHQRKWLETAARPLVAELRQRHGAFNFGHRDMGRHVFATSGFLDDSWFNRTYWMYADAWPGFYIANVAAKTGQLLVVGPEKTYALQAYPRRNMQSPLFTPGSTGYLLVADDNDNEPFLEDRTRETTKGWGFTRKDPPVWYDWVPIRIRAMVLADDALFVAGAPDVVDPQDPMASFEGRKGAVLRAISAQDGKVLSERKLATPPVFDGLIAADHRLFMCTTDGKVHCLGAAEPSAANPKQIP
jgi:outer membrane protein assembly factor BamB